MSTLTPQQQDAIAARGNALVAAGAGTGKTHTITLRCLDLVMREGCSVENILMVTFTEAAAAEMRERIRKALLEAAENAASDPDTANHLAEQIALLETAPISTLHSFCLELVRRNFHALGVDPQFTVLDEQQTKPLLHAVLDELFERHYAAKTPSVCDLVRHYGNGSDDAIRQLVVKIHHHAQALASPERWLAEQLAALNDSAPTAWRTHFISGVVEWAQFWREAVEPFARGCNNVKLCAQALDDILAKKSPAAIDAALAAILAAHEMKWDALKKDFRDPIKAVFTDAEFLHELARDEGAALAQDWEWTRHHMLTLLQLAREFTADFTRAKRELGGIDFADQEQLALSLLYDAAGNPSPVALACRERFRFVFVDECQDINAAQDAILRAVSREDAAPSERRLQAAETSPHTALPPEGGVPNAANRFLVGDVKQSIYRFRLADPRIFQNYEHEWSTNLPGRAGSPLPAVRGKTSDGAQRTARPTTESRVLALSENFRSREALLDFINPLFRALMRPVIGGLDYDADAELKFGNAAGRRELSRAADASPRVELHVITKASDGETGDDAPEGGTKPQDVIDLQTTEREARLIARLLRELHEKKQQVWDKDKKVFRDVDWSDMVVLMRGVAGRAEMFAKVFHQSGVPLHAARGGFLDAIEVADLLNLLRLLDNPLQDVPLLAVLRSPFVGLSADELVAVRLAQRDGSLWFALNRSQKPAAGSQENVWRKVQVFLEQFRRWRELIRHSSLTHCLETALTETHYEALLLAGERGKERAANVRRLVDLARRFDPFQREGLFRFLRFIAEQEDAGVRHEPAGVISENAVRLVTIHSSKGLEFPVVALAGLGAKFNARDLSADILLDDVLGLCPKVLPPESRRRYPSAAHWLAAQREKRALLGEEMRLLYVALTRARDTLILTGTASKKDEATRWREPAAVTDHALLKAGGALDWLRLWFAQSVKPESWTGENAGANELLRWKFHDPQAASFALDSSSTDASIALVQPPTAAELAALEKVFAARYPHAAATQETAKTSVSALRRRATEQDEESKHLFESKAQSPKSKVGSRRTASGRLSAAEIGTAHHAFLQLVALEHTATELDLRNEATRLEKAGALTGEQLEALDYGDLAAFWQSDLGQRVRTQPQQTIHREMQFTARLNAADLRALNLLAADAGLSDEEFVVVQGVADLVVVLPQEIWLLDFKTDDVDADGLAAKAKLYGPQLKLYALALARIYSRPVATCCLHFLKERQTVAVKI